MLVMMTTYRKISPDGERIAAVAKKKRIVPVAAIATKAAPAPG